MSASQALRHRIPGGGSDVRVVRTLAAIAACASSALTAPGAEGQIVFSDQTQAAGITAVHSTQGQQYPNPLTRLFPGGGAVGDFNRDGWQDLYVLGGGGAPDALYINNGDGTFTDQAQAWGLGSHMGFGAAVGDYNGDGLLDIFVISYGDAGEPSQPGRHRLYRNDGDSFTDVAEELGVNFSAFSFADGIGAAWGDYDLDGDLDLMVVGWNIFIPGRNRLFRNDGASGFTDVTSIINFPMSDVQAFTPRFTDMNGDRFPEILIAADFGTSRYLVNLGGVGFEDRTAPAGVGLDDNGMGQTVDDFNGDGQLDWYVTSIHADEPDSPATPGTGNMCYLNVAPHQFVEASMKNGLNDGGWGWGVVSADFDLDGDLDIAETNGWPEENISGAFEWLNDPPYVYENDGAGVFSRLPDDTIDAPGQGRGMLLFDADNDGDLDLVLFENDGPVRYFRNETNTPTANGGAWLRIFLDTTSNPNLAPDGFGAKVIVSAGASTQVRMIDSRTTYLSQSELSAHFGLADAAIVDSIKVVWPDGALTQIQNVPVNQTLTITPPQPAAAADLNGDGVVDGADLALLLAQWGGPGGADLNADNVVNGADLAMLLAQWTE